MLSCFLEGGSALPSIFIRLWNRLVYVEWQRQHYSMEMKAHNRVSWREMDEQVG